MSGPDDVLRDMEQGDIPHTHRWIDGELLTNGCPLPHAALLAEPVPGLDVERLARAIDDHGDNCSHMAIPECAGRIAAEYARLSETPDAD